MGLTACLVAPLAAQTSPNDHWRAVDAGIARIGGIEKLRQAPKDQVRPLADQFWRRGQFYLDLFEFHAELVRDHAAQRDSIGRSGGPGTPVARYFLARGLHESGRVREAASAYRALGNGLPPDLTADAAAWARTLTPGGPASWQQAVADWRAGKESAAPRCPPNTIACELFVAIRRSDVPAMTRLHGELMKAPRPAHVARISSARDSVFTVEFFDPIVPLLLSAADYSIAAVAYGVAGGAEAARGVALLRAGAYVEASKVLRTAAAQAPAVAPYLAEALARSGQQAEATRVLLAAAPAVQNVSWEVKGAVLPDTAGLRRYFAALDATALRRMRDNPAALGTNLARALLRHGLHVEALTVMESVSPTSAGYDVTLVSPSNIVLLSRARYHVGGRDDRRGELWPGSRGGIAALTARDVATVRPSLVLLQRLTAHAGAGDIHH